MKPQILAPSDYAKLTLKDQWIEDIMQETEVKWLLSVTREGERILDLGYGSGIVCRALHAAGRNIEVIDGAPEFVIEAWKLGIPAHECLFEHFDAPCIYDTIIMSFVLEHMADPLDILKRALRWGKRLIVVVGNAASWHRKIAVQMGIQERLDDLSERDKIVGHYRIYTPARIEIDLNAAGWAVKDKKGIMFKALPNSMLVNIPVDVVRAMCEIEVHWSQAGNIGLIAERK